MLPEPCQPAGESSISYQASAQRRPGKEEWIRGKIKEGARQRPDRAERDAAIAKALAEKLNVDEAKVKAALDDLRSEREAARAAALKERLDAAVKAGTLTQAEADAVQKAVEKGVIHADR